MSEMVNLDVRKLQEKGTEIQGQNRKDCDIGYAPATNSCEGVSDPDTCTVAVLDATTAFAVLNPGFLSQG